MNIELKIEKEIQNFPNITENNDEKDKQDEVINVNELEMENNIRDILYKTRDKKIDIDEKDILLDREDIARKYSRNCVFWFFADKYLKEDNQQAEPEVISIANDIILDEHKKALDLINEKFNHRPDIKMDIMKKIEQYKWKDDNYGNSRKKPKKFIEL